jgi:uncharacterized protein (TIGR02145 family)
MKKAFWIYQIIYTASILFLIEGCKKPDVLSTTSGAPIASTIYATNSSLTGETLFGHVNANGLPATVTFDYGTTASYGYTVTAYQSPVEGNYLQHVSADISGLTPGTNYHFRAKAENSLGTVYGNDVEFICGYPPEARTFLATNLTCTTATLNGAVNANAISTTVTFQYGITTDYGQEVTPEQSPVTGSNVTNVSADISDLSPGRTYHFRVKALNSIGTTNGSDVTFKTISSETVTDVDGNVYNNVSIGPQVWMTENLKTSRYNDGTSIPNITDNTAWSALTTGAYSDYRNNFSNSTTYGRLYNWYAVDAASNGGKNVCPTGWHVPTDAEWTTLITCLGGESVAGGKLKENGTTHWTTPNTGATNEKDFTALPGGYRQRDGTYSDMGSLGRWWSSSKSTTAGGAWLMSMFSSSTKATGAYGRFNRAGLSVRCVGDE